MSAREIVGVDFSGARDAGRKIWLARAHHEGETLVIDQVLPACALPGGGIDRTQALAALRHEIESHPHGAYGLDFPFALPAAVVGAEQWERFAASYPARYADAEAFRAACRAATGGREIKRVTDAIARVPFNAYNLRVYRQTDAGLREVIAPLVARDAARVLPMQAPDPDKPWLFEICPASTLKHRGLYYTPAGRPRTYKGQGAAPRAVRAALLEALTGLRLAEPGLRERLIEDAGGDALDAVIAAIGTATALAHWRDLPEPARRAAPVEGYIYF